MPLTMRPVVSAVLFKGNSAIRREMLGLGCLLLACVLLLALSTFSAEDPTFNQAVADTHEIQNGAGKLGAYLAGTLHDLFGAGSFFLPVVLLVAGLRLFLRQLAASGAPWWPWWRWLGLGLLAATLMAVGGGEWGARHIGLGDMVGGGFFGRILARWGALLLTPVGANILWTLTFLASLQLLAGQGFWRMLPRLQRWGEDQWNKHLERLMRREERRRRMEEGIGTPERQEFLFETLPCIAPVPPSSPSPAPGCAPSAAGSCVPPPPPPPPPAMFPAGQATLEAQLDAGQEFLWEASPAEPAGGPPQPVYGVQPECGLHPGPADAPGVPTRNIMDMICEEDETFTDPIPDREPVLPANFSSIKEKFRQALGGELAAGPDVLRTNAGAPWDDVPPPAPVPPPDTMRPAVVVRPMTVRPVAAVSPVPVVEQVASVEAVAPVAPVEPVAPVAPVEPIAPVESAEPVAPVELPEPVEPVVESYTMEEVAVFDRDLTLEEELAGPQTRQAPVAPVREAVLSRATLPPMQLLAPVPAQAHVVNPDELADQALRLTTCLADFNVQGDVHHVTPGPVVTMFEYKPAPGIKISRIANLSDDLALALKALAVRIEAPIPGKDMVGVEIPSKVRETVFFREILESDAFGQSDSLLTIALGKDIAGASAVADLSKMPHLLVAGATGAGKSVCLNSILLSILYKARPDEVRMLLIDPKRIELAVYSELPHLVHPVVTEMALAKNALDWAVHEMDQRYQAMARVGARNIQSYNERLAARRAEGSAPNDWADLDTMPYLLVVIDELADLMLTAAKEVETSVVRLAQLARAAGIHMILATQRPSVDVVTGLIKANFPCRISFQVTSKHDSRTILDAVGAERLLGKGDMLYKPSGGKVKRLHGCFVSDDDVVRVVEFWKRQQPPSYQLDFSEWGEAGGEEDGAAGGPGDLDTDPKYQEAKDFVLSQGKASISLIQRRFRIGFNRAARYVEQMEMDGIVGPADGAKPRPVLKS